MIKVTTEYINGLPYVSYKNEPEETHNKVIEVLNEDDMMAKIIDAVDNAPLYPFKHIGENVYDIMTPRLDLECGSYFWDNESNDELYQPLFIIRRPENTENKNDTNYIYDVHMKRGGVNDYVESLECVGMGILCAIYSYVAGNK